MELVKCNNLCKEFDNKKILKDVNLTISKGKIIGLLGKNGMGKTTFLKLINDLLTPTSGEVLINGEKPNINSKKVGCESPFRSISPTFSFTSSNVSVNSASEICCPSMTIRSFILTRCGEVNSPVRFPCARSMAST